jgi:hypothetical protein
MAHPEAAGRQRRLARLLIAAACLAVLLAASPAAAAPAHGAVLVAPAGASQAAAASSSSSAPSRTAAGAKGDRAAAPHSRSNWGRVEITVGVLVICFGVLAVRAARRRDRLARPSGPPPHHPLTFRRPGRLLATADLPAGWSAAPASPVPWR